ncbi:MAG: Fic family protein [Campylobacter sp.]|uniref:Fic family protein n=1 Tax=Campylobacter sp. TaxID=205 RepID=UPI00297AC86F|nr:Fic family protein [Campylobacter sp.]MDD7600483.1 Fic family protein [Campylobacteraceae bacterium]MDY5887330.1 Fic family protein [Campylobacter sp.]
MSAGVYKQNFSGELAYKYFLPSLLPVNIDLDDEMVVLLINASTELGRLDAIGEKIPSINPFLSMYVRKEALLSSQIEGTQASLDDVLDPNITKNQNQHLNEVINYIKAMNFGIEKLKNMPLCNRLLRNIHSELMLGLRGGDKYPGEFRKSQNWIGGLGSNLKNASYIPPAPHELDVLLSNFEKYLNDESAKYPLIQIALLHYQFESIHPFLDGNGRVGRLLIVLFLLEKKLLSKPILYISYFLKLNRVEYYDRLSAVRQSGNYAQWVKFFLTALAQSAKDASASINELSTLYEQNIAKIDALARNKNIKKLFLYINEYPIIDISKSASELGLSYNTLLKAVNALKELDILILGDESKSRNKLYFYEKYLEILRRDTQIL